MWSRLALGVDHARSKGRWRFYKKTSHHSANRGSRIKRKRTRSCRRERNIASARSAVNISAQNARSTHTGLDLTEQEIVGVRPTLAWNRRGYASILGATGYARSLRSRKETLRRDGEAFSASFSIGRDSPGRGVLSQVGRLRDKVIFRPIRQGRNDIRGNGHRSVLPDACPWLLCGEATCRQGASFRAVRDRNRVPTCSRHGTNARSCSATRQSSDGPAPEWSLSGQVPSRGSGLRPAGDSRSGAVRGRRSRSRAGVTCTYLTCPLHSTSTPPPPQGVTTRRAALDKRFRPGCGRNISHSHHAPTTGPGVGSSAPGFCHFTN